MLIITVISRSLQNETVHRKTIKNEKVKFYKAFMSRSHSSFTVFIYRFHATLPAFFHCFAAGQDFVTRIWSIASGELLRSIPFPEIMDKSLNQIPALYYSEAWGVGRGIPGLLYGAENSIYFYSF